ncbi:MAG: SGNH/GDSL hydrolase family protein, partial [Candidatus Electrothrix sp. AR3]|nr:SGNH/GDSL hydrolase family protein [Candidatus Electrothrix sp. AR3]
MRFLITPQMIPAPPSPDSIDPYQPNPYILQARLYFYFHIPKAVYTQARADYQVEYAINTKGFRGPEITIPKTEGIRRLVVIGDSIVEGHGNAFTKTFSYLLNDHFRNTGLEVVNAGVQGASPIYYATNAERYLSLQPDAVLIMLYENDIREDRIREAAYFKLPHIDDVDSILRSSSKSRMPLSYFYIALTRLHRNFILSPLERLIARNRKYVGMNKIPVQAG